jgi:MFS family permease
MSRYARVSLLIGTGHFLSHFYVLCLPPMFLAWQHSFDVSFAQLGLVVAVMSGVTALLQTPVGFMVDRHGARRFLVGGTLIMTLSMAAMGLATSFWQILLLAGLSGVGNSVIHPADYAILSASTDKSRMGRAFAWHTFSGNLGFAVAPPTVAALMLLIGWRPTLMVVGLIGIPLVAAILWQSRILQEPSSQAQPVHHQKISGGKLLLTVPMLLFFAFFMISSMASAGMAAWLITVLHTANGMHLEMASWGLTAYMAGVTGGVLVGGWVADRTKRLLTFATTITIMSSAILLVVAALHLPDVAIIALLAGSGIGFGASRTPRDMMLKDAAPPGEMGKVFGFVSSGMPLGQALTPVPFGFLIDRGHPELVLVLVAALLLLSLLCAGSARSTRSIAVAVAAE